jgi:hypothetical protein
MSPTGSLCIELCFVCVSEIITNFMPGGKEVLNDDIF